MDNNKQKKHSTLSRRKWLTYSGLAGIAMATNTSLLHAEPTDQIKELEKFSTPPLHYAPADGIVRLSSNENRYAPSPAIRQAMIDVMDKTYLYSPSHYKGLVNKLAAKEGVPPDHILLVSGSNEGLRLTGLVYGRNGGEIVTGTPTYKALLSYAELFDGKITSVPLDKDLTYDLQALEEKITDKTSLVFFCNPNNPTGTIVNGEDALNFCRKASEKTLVFSDEAYSDYIEEANYPTMVPLIKEGRNVIVSHTFSKVYGMAGVRVGYLIARPDIINMLKPRVMGYVNMMGLAGAEAALDDSEFYKYSLQKNNEAKELIYRVAEELGMRYVPSHTNFVFIETGMDAAELVDKMLEHKVRVGRPFPPLTKWCRVSTGTEEDMNKWADAMRKVFG
ncbi:MAG: histidinol-phosphate transaminase [Saprospiraceae bacterium]|nr:histidinol-phosphate transaminase [Saprospiraceae bacterium]